LVYRTEKALVGAPDSFASFDAGQGVRTPLEILIHMRQVLAWAGSFFEDRASEDRDRATEGRAAETLDEELALFRFTAAELGEVLGTVPLPETTSLERLLQGPLADAMTHAGQLAMLRRLAASPIRRENFHDAAVEALGMESSVLDQLPR